MTLNAEEQANPPTAATAQPPKATKPATSRHGSAVFAPGKPRSGKKGQLGRTAAQKPKGRQTVQARRRSREGSKAAKVLGLLRRPEGASLKELRTTGGLAHSVRGFLSGTVAKRMGLKLVSAKSEDGERRYTVRG